MPGPPFRRALYHLVTRLWRLGDLATWIAGLPVVGRLLGRVFFSPADNQAVLIPVHEAVQGGTNVVLPYTLLSDLMARASHRVILNQCLCRVGEGCTTYPSDFGCLFLGEGAARIDPALGHAVSVAEGQAHVARAMDLGLMPTILHAGLDAFVLQIPFRKMLAVCFCCDCCCTIRKGMRAAPEAIGDTVVPLPGLTVAVGDGCVGCGACVAACPVGAISLHGDRPVIGERCKGCGRCASACPEAAITLRLDPATDVRDRLWSLVAARTAIGPRDDAASPPAA